jgi:SAM-dependent methyltransferase
MTTTHEPYRKAVGSDHLAPYYDLMARVGMREHHLKGRVIDLAQLAPGGRMLDLGCGTGTLVLMASRRCPGATVIGVDGDPTILGIARRKAQRAGISVQLDEGMAYALPYEDGSFDAVVSTLAFHHLTPDQQARALAEVRRVLRPDGRLVIADLALPHNRLMRLAQHIPFGPRQHHGQQNGLQMGHRPPDVHLAGQANSRRTAVLEDLLRSNGWRSVTPTEHFMSIMGTIALYALKRPE